jgi:hypothetical protein
MKHLKHTLAAAAIAAALGIFGGAQEASAGGFYKHGGFHGGYHGFSTSRHGGLRYGHGFRSHKFGGRRFGFRNSRRSFRGNRGFRRGFSRRGGFRRFGR